jgi:hypothetical protein
MPGKGQVIHMLGFGAIKFLYTLLSPVIIAEKQPRLYVSEQALF